MSTQSLPGKGLMQSVDEWDTRNRVLARTLTELVISYGRVETGRGIDVGCQSGTLTDAVGSASAFKFVGIDPVMVAEEIVDAPAAKVDQAATNAAE